MKNVRLLGLRWKVGNLNKRIETHAKETIEISMSTFEKYNRKYLILG